jgi:hypothetical protein
MRVDRRFLEPRYVELSPKCFTVEEIATLCNVSRDFVSKVRAANDSPFCLNKCRPEWFADWMRLHPDFQLTKEMAQDSERSL